MPGVRGAVADLGVPLTTDAGAPLDAHGWASSVLAPYTLTSGRAPVSPDEVVVTGPGALGDRITLRHGGIGEEYAVVGIAAAPAPNRPTGNRRCSCPMPGSVSCGRTAPGSPRWVCSPTRAPMPPRWPPGSVTICRPRRAHLHRHRSRRRRISRRRCGPQRTDDAVRIVRGPGHPHRDVRGGEHAVAVDPAAPTRVRVAPRDGRHTGPGASPDRQRGAAGRRRRRAARCGSRLCARTGPRGTVRRGRCVVVGFRARVQPAPGRGRGSAGRRHRADRRGGRRPTSGPSGSHRGAAGVGRGAVLHR